MIDVTFAMCEKDPRTVMEEGARFAFDFPMFKSDAIRTRQPAELSVRSTISFTRRAERVSLSKRAPTAGQADPL
jgi:hypothetical protein